MRIVLALTLAVAIGAALDLSGMADMPHMLLLATLTALAIHGVSRYGSAGSRS